MTEIADSREFDPVDALTTRECEILELFARGLENKVIAAQLSISEETVKAHAKNIYRKLRVRNRTQATLMFLTHS